MPLQNINIQILIGQIQTQHSSVLSGVGTLITGEKKKKSLIKKNRLAKADLFAPLDRKILKAKEVILHGI